MTNYIAQLENVKRPRLLVRAARAGATRYRRDHHLGYFSKVEGIDSQAKLMAVLIAREAELEDVRKSGSADYNIHRHVHLLTALLAEAQSYETCALAA